MEDPDREGAHSGGVSFREFTASKMKEGMEDPDRDDHHDHHDHHDPHDRVLEELLMNESNLTQCLQNGTCSVNTTYTPPTEVANLSKTTAELFLATSITGNLTDPARLRYEVQERLNEELQKNGFVPGLTKEVDLEAELVGVPAADESGEPASELSETSPVLQPENPD